MSSRLMTFSLEIWLSELQSHSKSTDSTFTGHLNEKPSNLKGISKAKMNI
jgi:hypothetical protein